MQRLFPPGGVALAFGLSLLGSTGGCSCRTAEQPLDQSKIDREIPEGWAKTKAAMQERMKHMRKPGRR